MTAKFWLITIALVLAIAAYAIAIWLAFDIHYRLGWLMIAVILIFTANSIEKKLK